MSVIEKFKYKVNLTRYMADCDVNYMRLLKLVPDLRMTTDRRFTLAGNISGEIAIIVLEQTPYTTLLEMSRRSHAGVSVPGWLALSTLRLRLYHDAKVAEVVNCDRRSVPRSRYDYPNREMYQQDEKAQWNRFLSELLAHCLVHGYVGQTIIDPD